MDTSELAGTLTTLFSELVDGAPQGMAYMQLVDGAPQGMAYMLNQGDAGLLRSLDRLSAEVASASAHGGATIAAEARRRMRDFLTEGGAQPEESRVKPVPHLSHPGRMPDSAG